ncbi:MAG: inositol monophosphatase [Candidatus Handelsmanbacteria bacterium]|nr:inositol monophosphatase [Candidatus Handelsmanbacteria bacterium]
MSQAILDFALDLARRAGALISAERERGALALSYKEGIELLTSADLKSDQLIGEGIRAAFPGHQILSEESSPAMPQEERNRGPLWIIDPIDGTVNFAYGLAAVAISIAYAVDGVVQAGVVHSPFLGETYCGRRGGGATLNGAPIRASECVRLDRALIGTGFPYDRSQRPLLLRRLGRVLEHCRDFRRIGSAALDLCWVAAGRLDGFYETLKPWDFAAACLIAREAGAQTGHLGEVPAGMPPDLYGEEVVAAGPGIHADLVALLRSTSAGEGGQA